MIFFFFFLVSIQDLGIGALFHVDEVFSAFVFVDAGYIVFAAFVEFVNYIAIDADVYTYYILL